MTDKNVVSNSNSLLLWDRNWFLAQRIYMISKIAKKLKAQKELYEFVENNKQEISALCKVFKI